MNHTHRILPRRRPLHHHEPILIALLFIGLFAIFALFILASKLSPAKLSAQALNDRFATTVNITNATFHTCNLTIPTGTSLKSFNCLPLIISREDLFLNLSDNGNQVKVMYKYTPETDGQWQAFNASLPFGIVQTLTNVRTHDGIYFIMESDEDFVYAGILPSISNILIRQGWNLVGYPGNTTRAMATGIASINDSYEYIETLEGTEESGQYLWDAPPPGGDTLTNVTRYHGYWIRNSVQDYWVILK